MGCRRISWAWYAGARSREWFDLAGPCRTREQAIDHAHGSCDAEPGKPFFIVQAKLAKNPNPDGDYHVFAQRKYEELEFQP